MEEYSSGRNSYAKYLMIQRLRLFGLSLVLPRRSQSLVKCSINNWCIQ